MARDTGRRRDTRWCRGGRPRLRGWGLVPRAGCPWRVASCMVGTGGWGGRAAEQSCRAGSRADAGTPSGSLSPRERHHLRLIERKLPEGLITYPRPRCKNSKLRNCLSLRPHAAPGPSRGPGEGQPCVPSCPHRRGAQCRRWGSRTPPGSGVRQRHRSKGQLRGSVSHFPAAPRHPLLPPAGRGLISSVRRPSPPFRLTLRQLSTHLSVCLSICPSSGCQGHVLGQERPALGV